MARRRNPMLEMMKPQYDLRQGVNTGGTIGPQPFSTAQIDPRSLRFHAGGGGDGSRDQILQVPQEAPPVMLPRRPVEGVDHPPGSQGWAPGMRGLQDLEGRQYREGPRYASREDYLRGAPALDQGSALQMPDPGMDKAAFQMRNRHAIGDYSGVPSERHGLMEQAAGGITRMLSPLRRIADQGLFGNGPAPRLFGKRGQSQPMDDFYVRNTGADRDIDPGFSMKAPTDWGSDPGFTANGPIPDRYLQGGSQGGAGGAFVDNQGRLVDPDGRSRDQLFNDLASDPNVGISYEEMQRRTLPNTNQYSSPGSVAPMGMMGNPMLQQNLMDSFINTNSMWNANQARRQQVLDGLMAQSGREFNRARADDFWSSIAGVTGGITGALGNSSAAKLLGEQSTNLRNSAIAGRKSAQDRFALQNGFMDDTAARNKDLYTMMAGADPNSPQNQYKMTMAQASMLGKQYYGQQVAGQNQNVQNRNKETGRHNRTAEDQNQQKIDNDSWYRNEQIGLARGKLDLERQKIGAAITRGEITADQGYQRLEHLKSQLLEQIQHNRNSEYNTFHNNEMDYLRGLEGDLRGASNRFSDKKGNLQTRGTDEEIAQLQDRINQLRGGSPQPPASGAQQGALRERYGSGQQGAMAYYRSLKGDSRKKARAQFKQRFGVDPGE